MKKTRLFAVLAAALFALTACGSSAQTVEIRIDLTEFAYTPSTLELTVGQEVTLTLINVGALEHELMIGRELMKMDGLADGYMVDFFEFAGVEPVVTLPAGMEAEHAEEEGDDHGDADSDEHGEDHGDDEGDEYEHAHDGFMVTVQPGGEEVTVTFTVTEEMVGEWELGCLYSGHYEAGMHGTLIITN
jgi:uncharacterized cupredoxin-like copper-binding protein